jgi:hypothetical protein
MQDFRIPWRIKNSKTLPRTCFLTKNLCNMICGVLVWTRCPELELEVMYLNNLELVVPVFFLFFFLCRVFSPCGMRFYL